MLEFKNISMTYTNSKDENLVLNNINLNIKDGEYVVLYGESGSGKSTLLNIAAGLMYPYSGIITIDSKNLYKLTRKEICKFRNANIGYLPQNSSLLNSMSILDNVCIPSYLYNKSANRKDLYKKGKTLLEYVGMDKYMNDLPIKLSGGEKRRVEIARLLINNPKYIIADEPTANLDENNVRKILDIFKNINKEKSTLLISTHDNRFLKETDNIYKIKYGKLIL